LRPADRSERTLRECGRPIALRREPRAVGQQQVAAETAVKRVEVDTGQTRCRALERLGSPPGRGDVLGLEPLREIRRHELSGLVEPALEGGDGLGDPADEEEHRAGLEDDLAATVRVGSELERRGQVLDRGLRIDQPLGQRELVQDLSAGRIFEGLGECPSEVVGGRVSGSLPE
jgi:hypothetical protein